MHVNPQVIFKYHETETQVKMSPNATNPIIYLNFLPFHNKNYYLNNNPPGHITILSFDSHTDKNTSYHRICETTLKLHTFTLEHPALPEYCFSRTIIVFNVMQTVYLAVSKLQIIE